MKNLIRQIDAYKVIAQEKKLGKLSHAYLFLSSDENLLVEFSKAIAKLISCEEEEFCDNCRACRLINNFAHSDVCFYPKKDKKLSVSDADEIIEQSAIRPIELNKRVFVVNKVEELKQYQNKLLKTLEEPPRNVTIILTAKNDTAVLPTISSRSKIFTLPVFSSQTLFNHFKDILKDENKLRLSIFLAGGRALEVENFYNGEETLSLFNTVVEMLEKMKSAKDVGLFSRELQKYQPKIVVAVIKTCLGAMLTYILGKDDEFLDNRLKEVAKSFRQGTIIGVIDRLNQLEKTANFNANAVMLIDLVLFAIMEEKSKWQKLLA